MGAVYDDLDTFYLARPARCDDVNNASYGRWRDERGSTTSGGRVRRASCTPRR